MRSDEVSVDSMNTINSKFFYNGLREYLLTIFSSFVRNINAWHWTYWLFFYAIVPTVILAIAIQQQSIKDSLLVLNIYQPTPISMYFSNFTHSDIGHLSGNLMAYLIFVSLIFFLEDNPKITKLCIPFMFGILPFIVSASSIIYLSSIDRHIPPSQGFSGILAAIMGYGLFLLAKWMYEQFTRPFFENWDKQSRVQKIGGVAEFVLVAYLIVAILGFGFNFGLFSVDGGALANGVAHFTGFIFGLSLPLVIGFCHQRAEYPFYLMFGAGIVAISFQYYHYLLKFPALIV